MVTFIGLMLSALLLCASLSTSAALNLREVWNFSAPALRDPDLDPNGLRINVLYNVSDFIVPSMVNYSVSNWDCNFTVEEFFVPSLVSPEPGFAQGDGSGDGVIEVEINVNPDSFETANRDSFETNTASFWQRDGEDLYRIRFCLFVGVQTDDDNPTIVDSSETNIMVTYDLTSGFAVTVDVEPVRSSQDVQEGYGVDGFFCDENNVELSEDQMQSLGSPGSELKVCVVPDEQARESGSFSIDQIDKFEWIRVDERTGIEIRQLAVIDGQSPDPLTQLECDDDGCRFVSILKANFFQENIPTPPPTQAPTPAPTPPPPPAPPGLEKVGGTGYGYCADSSGNTYGYYEPEQSTGTVWDCPSKCSSLASMLRSNGYTEQVRGFEHFTNTARDPENTNIGTCKCMVDGTFGDRGEPGFTFYTRATPNTAAAIGPVDRIVSGGAYTECYKYQQGSYYFQYSSFPYTGSLNTLGSEFGTYGRSCSDQDGAETDYIAIYDVNQIDRRPYSALFLCQQFMGDSLLGITIIRDANDPPPSTPPYSVSGNYQVRCHAALDGISDPRIAAAQAYSYPTGQGFAFAETSQPGTVVSSTVEWGTQNSDCLLFVPPRMEFLGEGFCLDNDGNLFASYSPLGTAFVANCPSECDLLASELQVYPEEVRGFEYENGKCRCLVDGGYGDRGIASFEYKTAAAAYQQQDAVSAISPIQQVGTSAGVACYRHGNERYEPIESSFGSIYSVGSSPCGDGNGEELDYIAFYDVNQKLGIDSSSCVSLCENILGTGLLGVSIKREVSSARPSTAPYTGGGDYQCRCHLVLDGPNDTRIASAQTHSYRSGQGFASFDSSLNGTSISQSLTSLGSSWNCYRYAPPSHDFPSYPSEGYCTDEVGNLYNHYMVDSGGSVVQDCPDQCDNLASQLASYPEAVRGFEYDGPTCRCVVDGGYEDRVIPGFSFGNITIAGDAAVSPIQAVSSQVGFTCYEHTNEMYRIPGTYSGSLIYRGQGPCKSPDGVLDAVHLFDVNQKSGFDPYACGRLCNSVFGTPFLGFTLTRAPSDPLPPSATYSGSGFYQCSCNLDLTGPADSRIATAESYLYPSGTSYSYASSSGTGTSISGISFSNPDYRCYEYASRRNLQDITNEDSHSITTEDYSTVVSAVNDKNVAEYFSEPPNPYSSLTENEDRLAADLHKKDSSSEQKRLRRNLQADSRARIGGAGQATLKFSRRVYRRNLLTGEDGWVTETEYIKRNLQVGQASDFNVDLEVTLFGNSQGSSANIVSAGSLVSVAIISLTALACILFEM